MYPHPEINSYLQGFRAYMPKKILNQAVDKALLESCRNSEFKLHETRLLSIQPQCYSPCVDVTRSKCAFGSLALPKLKRDIFSDDSLLVRQTITTLSDLLVNPEKSIEAVELNITDSLSDFLISNDPYLRERVAMIYATIANQTAGRESILRNLNTVLNLSKGLDDCLAAVRLKIAQTLEALARDYSAAEQLCACGFVESITAKLCLEKKEILLVYLDTLKLLLLYGNIKEKATKDETFEKLTILLNRKDEFVLCKALSCIAVLCEDIRGKDKAIEMDILQSLKTFLQDKTQKESVKVEAARVASFITIATAGKLQILKLRMTSLLLRLMSKYCCNTQLLLSIVKTLTNIAEAPEGRRILLQDVKFIESIDAGDSEQLERHKLTLLDVIRWRP